MEKKNGKKRGEKKEKTDENSGHYVIASSRPPERRPLERRTLAPKVCDGCVGGRWWRCLGLTYCSADQAEQYDFLKASDTCTHGPRERFGSESSLPDGDLLAVTRALLHR